MQKQLLFCQYIDRFCLKWLYFLNLCPESWSWVVFLTPTWLASLGFSMASCLITFSASLVHPQDSPRWSLLCPGTVASLRSQHVSVTDHHLEFWLGLSVLTGDKGAASYSLSSSCSIWLTVISQWMFDNRINDSHFWKWGTTYECSWRSLVFLLHKDISKSELWKKKAKVACRAETLGNTTYNVFAQFFGGCLHRYQTTGPLALREFEK